MQQWFEQKESYSISSIVPPAEKFQSVPRSLSENKMPLLKTFIVEAETLKGQYICVSGNCPTLGNWNVNEAFVLSKTNESSIKHNRTYYRWRGTVHLPAEKKIFYRYFVGFILKPEETQKEIFVHSWESHDEPRVVKFVNESQISSSDTTSPLDIYGFHGKQQISKGFLTSESAVQFKLYNTPLQFWNTNLQSKAGLFSVKMMPVRLSKLSKDTSLNDTNLLFDDSNSQANDDSWNIDWPLLECVDIPSDHSFHLQTQFGTVIKENGFHLFQARLDNFGYTGFRFDIYLHPEAHEELPRHIGFTHILPGNMKYSNGVVMCPVTSVRHKPIGELKIDYLIIKPTKDIHCNLEKIIDWKSSYIPLDIGHRGSGSSFKQIVYDCTDIRENTIASLKEAGNKGADFVEFDVQLSKDLVPVLYHDFNVSMAITSKTDLLADNVEMVQVPMKNMSYEQLQQLKIYHVKEPHSLDKTHYLNDVRDDYQPFPKLEKALTDVDIDVGFNVELKWTMQLQDGSYELDNPFDMNLFVDTILKTVFTFVGSRSIVFSCFHPDVCTMLKMKQNRYPVLFLTQGVTERYPPYDDPRCHTIQNAVYFSASHDLLGVNVHSEDLLRDQTQISIVKEAGLALFCWGDDNNCKDVVNKFKELGVNAVIYDKLDKNDLMKKKRTCLKSDVFIAKNYCNQNEILKSNQLPVKGDPHKRENNDREGDNNRYFLDVGKVGFQNPCSSTETLWNENNPSVIPKHKLNTNQALETDAQTNVSKKLKSDVQ